jgi:hypothetical protein
MRAGCEQRDGRIRMFQAFDGDRTFLGPVRPRQISHRRATRHCQRGIGATVRRATVHGQQPCPLRHRQGRRQQDGRTPGRLVHSEQRLQFGTDIGLPEFMHLVHDQDLRREAEVAERLELDRQHGQQRLVDGSHTHIRQQSPATAFRKPLGAGSIVLALDCRVHDVPKIDGKPGSSMCQREGCPHTEQFPDDLHGPSKHRIRSCHRRQGNEQAAPLARQ